MSDIKEVYTNLHGNYEEALKRLMNDKLILRFMLKFLNDPSMSQLEEAVAEGNIETSFRAAHTLKGVAANLAFTELCQRASELTEQLRPLTAVADTELLAKVRESYELVINTIKSVEAE